MRWLEGFGFGVGGSYEHLQSTNTAGLPGTTGGSLPGYATTGQQQFFAYNPANRAVVLAEGDHWRLSPQASYTFGPFGLLAEYAISNQKVTRTGTAPQPSARLEHMGWQLAGSWLLTGEDAILGTVVPRRPFDPRKGSWGALQVVARYSELDIDSAVFPLFADPRTSARGAQEWSLGLNWYLNRNLKVSSSFSHTTFEGAGRSASSVPGKVTRKPENVLFTRVQVAF
jgi:phosphate-selective porin OprO/OprP